MSDKGASIADLTKAPVQFKGIELHPIVMKDYGALERKYRDIELEQVSKRVDGMAWLSGDEKTAEYLKNYDDIKVNCLMSNPVWRKKMFDWINTVDGALFFVYLSLKHTQPDVSPEEAAAIFDDEDMDFVIYTILEISGMKKFIPAENLAEYNKKKASLLKQ